MSSVSPRLHHLSAAHRMSASRLRGGRLGGSGHMWDSMIALTRSLTPRSSTAFSAA